MQRKQIALALSWLVCFLCGWMIARLYSPSLSPLVIKLIKEHSKTFALESELVEALILTESGGSPSAVSSKGAIGLMQLMPEVGLQLAESLKMKIRKEDLFQPEINIRLGCYYLHLLLRKFEGDLVAALAAYNTGPSRVSHWLSSCHTTSSLQVIEARASKETVQFIKKVLKRFQLRTTTKAARNGTS